MINLYLIDYYNLFKSNGLSVYVKRLCKGMVTCLSTTWNGGHVQDMAISGMVYDGSGRVVREQAITIGARLIVMSASMVPGMVGRLALYQVMGISRPVL